MSTRRGQSGEETIDVVTAIVMARGRILLLRRSARVSSFRGLWAGVSGSRKRGERPRAAALREIAEELGWRSERLAVAREAPAILVEDPGRARRYRVAPVLCLSRGMQEPILNWENDAARWMPPENLVSLATVPMLREVVEALLGKGACAVPRAGRRSLDRILEDRASGCLALARRSASLVARSGNEPVPPETLARLLTLGRPSFFGIGNACADAVAARARGGAKAARGVASGLAGARLRAAERAARGLTGRRVIVTSSASGTVEEALALWMRERSALEVRVLESRPPSEGAKLAARLAARGGPRVVLYPDAAMESAVSGADAVLLGADAVFRDGGIANKTGSLPLARSARARGVPVFVVAESVKRARSAAQEALWLAEDGPAGEYRPPLPRRGAARVALENPSFERVPARLISALWGDRRDGSC